MLLTVVPSFHLIKNPIKKQFYLLLALSLRNIIFLILSNSMNNTVIFGNLISEPGGFTKICSAFPPGNRVVVGHISVN